MGFRIGKSFTLSKGVRLTASKSGLGVSFGVRGARYSVHSSGRRTKSIGVPGSGVRYQTTSRGPARPKTRRPSPAPAPPRGPGLFAPRWEKELHAAIACGDPGVLAEVGAAHPDARTLAYSLVAFQTAGSDADRARRMAEEVMAAGDDPASSSFITEYLSADSHVAVQIAPGLKAALPISRDAVGLLLAELYQQAGEHQRAIDVVEDLSPSAHAAVSLAELYIQAERHQDVIELTDRVANEDDATALLCIYRAVAFREMGSPDLSLLAFKEGLRARSRAMEIRHLALEERARTYERLGQKAKARKDLERILAEDAAAPGIRDRLDRLGGDERA